MTTKQRIELWIGDCPLRKSAIAGIKDNYISSGSTLVEQVRASTQLISLRNTLAIALNAKPENLDLRKEVIKAYQEPNK